MYNKWPRVILQVLSPYLKATISQCRHTDGHQAHEKMLDVTNHQGSANHGEKGAFVHCW